MNTLLIDAIEQWAKETPFHPAFKFNGVELNYTDLWTRAGQVAYVLENNGVEHGDRVGIYMNKGLETAVALYGILRAGAVFVPLDASAPIDRIEQMVTHCGINVLISQPLKQNNLVSLSNLVDLSCVIGTTAFDDSVKTIPWHDIYEIQEMPSSSTLDQHDLAYIMYTSGSTGLPKGIMHTHYSGLSYAKMSAECYGLNQSDRLGNHSPLHFDMSTLDYLTGPLVGATTVIIPEAYTKLPASLSQLIEDERLTIWYSVPYALIQLLMRGVLEQRDLTSLRWVLFGGEPFPPQHLYALMKQWPHATFSNVYGPAEVNQCTDYNVPRSLIETDKKAEKPVPIGYLCKGVDILIVDDEDLQVADGEGGELLVHASTMMKGYWDQPSLNKNAFFDWVENTHTKRFYRTGDLVRRNEQGLLEFSGRKDRQVKVRGYRVELDEIESVIGSHPDVEENCVYAFPTSTDYLQIEAAVIARKNSAVTVEALTKFVSNHLPFYAVPAKLFIHSEFLRTTSGKVNRTAMQKQAQERYNIEVNL